jgi:glycosyltransferase involved in cell wall biosynthesis
MGHPRARLSVIPTGIPLPPETDRRTVDPFTIGHLSGIRPAKGLDLLTEALRILVHERGKSVRLLIGGRVLDTAFWRRIGQSVREHRLDKHVEYLGEMPPDQIAAFHARCSVFCVPSRFPEPRGVAVLEAMAAGVPVIAPDSGTYPELINTHGGGMLVSPSDPVVIADAVDTFIQNPTSVESLGQQARNVVAAHCDPDQTARQTLDQYEAVLGGQASIRVGAN